MSTLSQHELISALTSLPEREMAAVVAVALEKRELTTRTARPAAEGRCCGLTFTSHARRVMCPLCGQVARAT